MGFDTVFLFILSFGIVLVDGNTEGDILHNWRTTLNDPNNVLQSWDPTLVNPCTWFHITCNLDNVVVRVDLGNAGLSGPISPLLGNLTNLQYLELFDNSFKGEIPATLGELKRLISLDLYENKLSGSIPATLGNLKLLRFLRLNGNALTGDIPAQVLNLVPRGSLEILNVSNNLLAGRKPAHSKDLVITTIIQDPRA